MATVPSTDHIGNATQAAIARLLETATHEDGWLSDMHGHSPYEGSSGAEVLFNYLDGSIDLQHAVEEVVMAMQPHIDAMVAEEVAAAIARV